MIHPTFSARHLHFLAVPASFVSVSYYPFCPSMSPLLSYYKATSHLCVCVIVFPSISLLFQMLLCLTTLLTLCHLVKFICNLIKFYEFYVQAFTFKKWIWETLAIHLVSGNNAKRSLSLSHPFLMHEVSIWRLLAKHIEQSRKQFFLKVTKFIYHLLYLGKGHRHLNTWADGAFWQKKPDHALQFNTLFDRLFFLSS